jgi:hypothetical protein
MKRRAMICRLPRSARTPQQPRTREYWHKTMRRAPIRPLAHFAHFAHFAHLAHLFARVRGPASRVLRRLRSPCRTTTTGPIGCGS